jgi:hypothetical protein
MTMPLMLYMLGMQNAEAQGADRATASRAGVMQAILGTTTAGIVVGSELARREVEQVTGTTSRQAPLLGGIRIPSGAASAAAQIRPIQPPIPMPGIRVISHSAVAGLLWPQAARRAAKATTTKAPRKKKKGKKKAK